MGASHQHEEEEDDDGEGGGASRGAEAEPIVGARRVALARYRRVMRGICIRGRARSFSVIRKEAW